MATKSSLSSFASRLGSLAKTAANQSRQAETYIPRTFVSGFNAGNIVRQAAQAVAPATRAPVSTYSGGGSSGGGGGSSYGSGGSRAWSSGGGGGGGGGGGAAATPAYVAPVVDTRMVNGPYAPRYLMSGADAIAENPGIMLTDLMQRFAGSDGLGDNAITAQLEPYMDLMNPLFMAMNGNGNADAAGKEAFVNWLGAQIDAMVTPGQYMNVGPSVNNVLNPAAGSLLQNFIAQGTAQEQANNTNALLQAASAMALHPGFQKSVRNSLDEAEMSYLAAAAKGPVDPFYQYLQTTLPDVAKLIPGVRR